ncbi:MAG: dihydroorotate dehydrogenase [Bacteroidetes bacterium]|jgi:dihydroorotate dehydrogenase (NAD+) catalytic subunit|nr:dihydroorotate dehydrogenase [Bacteroidota bacterium]
MVTTSFCLRGVEFANRVFAASGTFGYGDEVLDLADPSRLGGIMTKSLSWKPRDGNAPRRVVETASGMLNSIGLANIGVHAFIETKLPTLRTLRTRIVANIAASSVDEYAQVLTLLDSQEGVDAFEINVSCPNVKEGGLNFGTNVDRTREITRRLRPLTQRPLIVKLTPNVTHISEFARAVEAEGADAVSLINTLVGMAVDIRTGRPKLSTVTGGLSGPAIKPVALAKVYEVAKAVKIPIFGIGGIMSAEDAVEFLMVGASAVEIGTLNYIDPAAGGRIAEGIAAFAAEKGLSDVGQLVGSLKADLSASILQSWL